ncbi:MAG TPA: lytic transglycosylase domain-containing protein [Thermoleophilaceae bacterium]|nr:lytic transglycosylase domain-containing protein [Thermoleophilaceae bacterium]
MHRRRRIIAVLVAASIGAFAAASVAGLGPLGETVREVTLPLRHEDIIRQQASDKDLDPALIAAVIFEESRFRDQTSHAGARGLMQITPATARFIARDSGGTAFVEGDLATPQVNISYGSYYMRYLLRRYDGDVTLAVAAYNAGETNVNKWVDRAGGREAFDAEDDVPFKETRDYVRDVMEKRQQYRDNYQDELGL